MAMFLSITIIGLLIAISIFLAVWLCKPYKSRGCLSMIFRVSGTVLLGNVIFRLLLHFSIWFLTLSNK